MIVGAAVTTWDEIIPDTLLSGIVMGVSVLVKEKTAFPPPPPPPPQARNEPDNAMTKTKTNTRADCFTKNLLCRLIPNKYFKGLIGEYFKGLIGGCFMGFYTVLLTNALRLLGGQAVYCDVSDCLSRKCCNTRPVPKGFHEKEKRNEIIRQAFNCYGYSQTELGDFLSLCQASISRITNKKGS